MNIKDVPQTDVFYAFQKQLNLPEDEVPTHKLIQGYISECGKDYRYQDKEHPVEALRNREVDNTTVGIFSDVLSSLDF